MTSFIFLIGCRPNAVAERFSFAIEDEQTAYTEFLQTINKEHPFESGIDAFVHWSYALDNLERKMDSIANKSKISKNSKRQ